MNTLLQVTHLQAAYGQSRVLHGVNLSVNAGEVVCLLGRNGSGRSTLLRSLMGLVPAQGEMLWRGHNISPKRPFERAQQGLGYVPENREVFPSLTVAQNLLLGVKPGQRPGRWSQATLLDLFPRLKERLHTAAGHLSGGEQQMLTLCRTMMGDPDLVLVDEPTEGLAPALVEQVARFITALREQGVAVLLVEQKLTIALQVSSRCLVMGHGRIVFEGTPEQLRGAVDVQQQWLGV
ncbi:MAG: ABC transporter ATP-binding protein [Burkholderiales bacterium]